MIKLYKKIMLIISISLFLVIGIMPTNVFAESKDVSQFVQFGQNKMEVSKGNDEWETVYENGGYVENSKPIYTGNKLRFTFTWSIRDLISNNIKPGDYFEIKLPTELMSFVSTESKTLTDSSGKPLGEFFINKESGKVIVKFDDNIEGRLDITNGTFNAIGTADKKTNGSTSFELAGENIPFEVHQSKTLWGDVGHMNKQGWQEGTSNQVYWSLFVNQTNLKNAYEGRESKLVSNVLLEDTIEKNMTLDRMTINAPLMLSESSGKLTWKSFSNKDITGEFEIVTQNPDETYAAFRDRVSGNVSPARGMYIDENGVNHLLISFKNLPGSDLANLTLQDAIARLDTFKLSNPEYFENDEYNLTVEDITKVYELSNGTGIIMPSVSIWSTVSGGNQVLSNTAKLTYNNTVTEESTSTIKYIDYKGGAETVDPQSIRINKMNAETNELLEGVEFELHRMNASGIYEKYQGAIATDASGNSEFKLLPYGKFKIIETKNLEGYENRVTFVDASGNVSENEYYFEIDGTETKGIYLSAYNYKNKLVRIEGTKTWDDANNQDGLRPDTITVNLMKGTDIVATQEVGADQNWTYAFENLAEFENGAAIVYHIEEVAVPGYETTINGYNLSNKHVPSTIRIEGTKTWDDANNQDGLRPDTITVNLMKGTDIVATQEVGADQNWTYA
ncbi:Cna B-type domain-containing protein, partial [Erysipelothrix anatis]|uniref:Cna B-type domain-containing protein n=1 Tax=Erysipelothrix anatis TaxID=2683713 RepID=UPI001914DC58